MTGFSDAITSSRYVRLTTFRRSGEAVPTPVWATQDGDTLTVVTQAPSGKVKRLRNSPVVAIAPSDWRGNPKGDEMRGTVEIIDDSDALDSAQQRSKKRFGFEFTIMDFIGKVRRDNVPRVVLRITATTDSEAPETA